MTLFIVDRCDLNGKRTSYLCGNTTVFNQITLVCDYWFNVDCERYDASTGMHSIMTSNGNRINLRSKKGPIFCILHCGSFWTGQWRLQTLPIRACTRTRCSSKLLPATTFRPTQCRCPGSTLPSVHPTPKMPQWLCRRHRPQKWPLRRPVFVWLRAKRQSPRKSPRKRQ